MILIVSARDDLTCDFVVLELRRRGIPYFRFNTEDFPTRLSVRWPDPAGSLATLQQSRQSVPLEDVTSVWYRRPRGPSFDSSRPADAPIRAFIEEEAQATIGNIWRSLDGVLWVSDPDRIRRASYKVPQLKLAREIGFQVPATVIANDTDTLLSFYDQHGGAVVAKRLSHQASNQAQRYLIYTTKISREDITPESVSAPVLMQAYVPKDRELRVTVVGRRVFAVALDSQTVPNALVDWRRETLNVPHERVTLPAKLETMLISMTERLGLQFGAYDLVETPGGDIVFLELNPNGQWAWLQKLTGVPITEALVDLLAQGSSPRRTVGAIRRSSSESLG